MEENTEEEVSDTTAPAASTTAPVQITELVAKLNELTLALQDLKKQWENVSLEEIKEEKDADDTVTKGHSKSPKKSDTDASEKKKKEESVEDRIEAMLKELMTLVQSAKGKDSDTEEDEEAAKNKQSDADPLSTAAILKRIVTSITICINLVRNLSSKKDDTNTNANKTEEQDSVKDSVLEKLDKISQQLDNIKEQIDELQNPANAQEQPDIQLNQSTDSENPVTLVVQSCDVPDIKANNSASEQQEQLHTSTHHKHQ